MAIIITMPRLSPTMEEGVLAKWLKQEGEKINPGDIIAEVETDKANMDFPLEDEGTLLKKIVDAGTTVKLGSPVGILGKAGEDISALLSELSGNSSAQKGTSSSPAIPGTPQATTATSIPPISKTESTQGLQKSGETSTPVTSVSKQSQSIEQTKGSTSQNQGITSAEQGRILASPLAKRLAQEANLDVRQIEGSGPKGRIIKRDVAQTLENRSSISMKSLSGITPSTPSMEKHITPLSMMRKTIARRLVEAKQTVPHFYLTVDIQMDALWSFREQINRSLEESGSKLSVNDFIAKATARALYLNPSANVSFSEEGVIQHSQVDLGIAVALPDGLLTPVVRQAEHKSLGAISSEIKELAERGKQKKLRPEEYQGATFTISNLGMYGISQFAAIINPPESGILAIGQVEKRPIVVEKEGMDHIVVSRMMTVTLSCDHRVVDGAVGSQLLASIKKSLEQPLLLVL